MSMIGGTPDWYHPNAPLPAPLVNIPQRAMVGAGETFGPFFVAPFQVIALDSLFGAPVATLTFSIAFYQDQACTIALGSFSWMVVQGQRLIDVVPVLGAWCKIGVSETNGNVGRLFQVRATPYVAELTRAMLVGGTELANVNGAVIAAGANATFQFGAVTRALATFFVAANIKNWRGEVWEMNGAGAAHYLVASIDGGNVYYSRDTRYSGSNSGCMVILRNDDSLAGTFYARSIAEG